MKTLILAAVLALPTAASAQNIAQQLQELGVIQTVPEVVTTAPVVVINPTVQDPKPERKTRRTYRQRSGRAHRSRRK